MHFKLGNKISIILFITLCSDFTFAQWVEKNNGLYGGEVLDMLAHDGYIYAGTRGGLYRSADNGLTWDPFGEELRRVSVKSLGFSKGILFAATYTKGLLISNDNGAHWTSSKTGLPFSSISDLASTNEYMFGRTFDGELYKSNDGGQNWVKANANTNPESFSYSISQLTSAGNYVYYGNKTGVYRSGNNDESWEKVSVGLPSSELFLLEASNNCLISNFSGGTYFSNNNGDSWGITPFDQFPPRGFLSVGDNVIVATSTNVYRSINKGATWETIGGLNKSNKLISVSGLIIAGGVTGIHYSTNNGDNWIEANQGMTNPFIVDFTTAKGKLFVLTNIGIYRSDDLGDSWRNIQNDLPFDDIREIEGVGENLLASLYKTGTYNYSIENDTWEQTSEIKSISIFHETETKLFAAGVDLYESINGGATWEKVSGSAHYFYKLSSVGDNLYAVASDFGPQVIYASTTGGTSWSNISGDIDEALSLISLKAYKNRLFIGTGSKGIYRAENLLPPWVPSSQGTSDNTNVVSDFVSNDDFLFAATSTGIYYSVDLGNSWLLVNRDGETLNYLGNTNKLILTDGNLFAGTSSNGVFIWTGCYPPERPKIIVNANNTLSSNQPEGNQWFLNGSLLAGETSVELTPLVSGSYTVVSTKDGCESAPSLPSFITQNQIITSINELDHHASRFSVSPNPAFNKLRIDLESFNKDQSNEISLFDQTGRLLYKFKPLDEVVDLDLSYYDNGLYIVKIIQGNWSETARFIKMTSN